MRRNDPGLLRKALDEIASIAGAPHGSHPDDVIRVVRDMQTDPTRHNEQRARALYIARRLVDSLENLVQNSTDPGTEAMGALWEGKEFARVGGAVRPPLPADIDPDRLHDEIEQALAEAAGDELSSDEEAAEVVATVLRHVRQGA